MSQQQQGRSIHPHHRLSFWSGASLRPCKFISRCLWRWILLHLLQWAMQTTGSFNWKWTSCLFLQRKKQMNSQLLYHTRTEMCSTHCHTCSLKRCDWMCSSCLGWILRYSNVSFQRSKLLLVQLRFHVLPSAEGVPCSSIFNGHNTFTEPQWIMEVTHLLCFSQ